MPGMVTSHRACRFFFGLGLYYWTISLIYSIQQNRWDSIGCPTHVAAKIQAWRLFLFSTSWSAHPVSFLNTGKGACRMARQRVHESVSSGAKALWEKYMQMHRQPTPITSPWACLFRNLWLLDHESTSLCPQDEKLWRNVGLQIHREPTAIWMSVMPVCFGNWWLVDIFGQVSFCKTSWADSWQ